MKFKADSIKLFFQNSTNKQKKGERKITTIFLENGKVRIIWKKEKEFKFEMKSKFWKVAISPKNKEEIIKNEFRAKRKDWNFCVHLFCFRHHQHTSDFVSAFDLFDLIGFDCVSFWFEWIEIVLDPDLFVCVCDFNFRFSFSSHRHCNHWHHLRTMNAFSSVYACHGAPLCFC